MSSPGAFILQEVMSQGEGTHFFGIAQGNFKLCNQVPDGVVLVERKVWVWREDGRQEVRAQDTWFFSNYSDDCLKAGWQDFVRQHTERGRGGMYTPIRTEEVGPVEIPRTGNEGFNRWATRRIQSGLPIQMRIGTLEIDASRFMAERPWYAEFVDMI